MKLVRTVTLLLALTGASTAFAGAPGKAPPPASKAPEKPAASAPSELSAADAAKLERFVNQLADAMVANKDSCPKLGPAITAILDKHEPEIKKIVESGKEPPQSSKDKMNKRQGDMMAAITKCKDDQVVMAAVTRLMNMAQKRPAEPTGTAGKK
jgi:hypothetical protein